MPRTPLTKAQAERISKDYQYLIGKDVVNEHGVTATVAAVSIAPYDDINKYIFLLAYCECKNVEEALANYMGHVFDVLILGTCTSEHAELVHRELIPYLSDNGIEFDDAKYL